MVRFRSQTGGWPASGATRYLESLDLRDTSVSDEGLQGLTGLIKLRSLVLGPHGDR